LELPNIDRKRLPVIFSSVKNAVSVFFTISSHINPVEYSRCTKPILDVLGRKKSNHVTKINVKMFLFHQSKAKMPYRHDILFDFGHLKFRENDVILLLSGLSQLDYRYKKDQSWKFL
jgi:hypothetical protein